MGPRPASTARLWGPVWPLGEDPAELPSPDLRRLERTRAKEVGNRESPGCLREGQEERHPSWKPVSTDGSHGLGCAARRLCPRRRPSPPGFQVRSSRASTPTNPGAVGIHPAEALRPQPTWGNALCSFLPCLLCVLG